MGAYQYCSCGQGRDEPKHPQDELGRYGQLPQCNSCGKYWEPCRSVEDWLCELADRIVELENKKEQLK